jgi:hypothetical protein
VDSLSSIDSFYFHYFTLFYLNAQASRNGGEFTEMMKRDALARERAESKRKEKEEKVAREAMEEQEAKNKQRKILLERSRPKEAMTWAEMQEVQERMREDRIALRVVEMSSRIGKHHGLLFFLTKKPSSTNPLILPLLLFLPLPRPLLYPFHLFLPLLLKYL